VLRSPIPWKDTRLRHRCSSCAQRNGFSSFHRRTGLEYSGRDSNNAVSNTFCGSHERAAKSGCSFHLDHAAALTYITEKVCILHQLAAIVLKTCSDEFQRWKGQGLHDSSHQSSSQIHDARLRSSEVRLRSRFCSIFTTRISALPLPMRYSLRWI